MKKLLILFFTFFLGISFAKQNVSIVWPFSIGANQVNFLRLIIDEANKQQNKYNFIVEFKPGAGGTIGANHVLNNNQLTLLASSSSFFIRPVIYPNESYNTKDFRPIYIECIGQPLIISSSKYTSLNEIKKQSRLTIGITPGSVTEIAAKELRKHLLNTQLDFIPYQGAHLVLNDTISGNLDLAISWPADTKQLVESKKINVIGISGIKDFNQFKTFHSQNIKGFEDLVISYLIVANSKIADDQAEELHKILKRGAQSSLNIKNLFDADICTPVDYNWNQTNEIYIRWQNYWFEKIK